MSHTSLWSQLRASHRIYCIAIAALIGFIACDKQATDINMPQPEQNAMVIPPGFPQPAIPQDNPITSDKIELGRRLFYDVALSKDNSTSCASCHRVTGGFSDFGKKVSAGEFHETGFRNSIALANVAYDSVFFWDGRAKSLESQVRFPFLNQAELGLDTATLVSKLQGNVVYARLFERGFGDSHVTMDRVARAIATFERTIVSGASDYDRYMAGDKSALSDAALRGLTLFNSKEVNCVGCHTGFNFTDNQFHSTGLDLVYSDVGLEDITGRPNDNGKFLTPSLRNVALTTPYMHDGRFDKLEQVLDHYNQGGMHNSTQDSLIRPLHLNGGQVSDIIAFLNSLTDRTMAANRAYSNPFVQ